MSRNIRIRTEPNGGDNHVKIQLNQDFDFLEILSLKINQEDVYRSFYSDYGVVVGRVIMNSGVGVPNARISIFIPLTDEDAENTELVSIYPYSDISITNSDGIRYNTLPNDTKRECHTPVGTFPTKREVVDNEKILEVYSKYYKYTTTTNDAGDFMLFGVPVGNHMLNVDVDLSDIGIFSQRPYDFIEQGNPTKLFESPTKFKSGTNLNNLTQLKNRQLGINVIPFWGDVLDNEVGISRVDIDLNYNIQPSAIFIGSIFGDNEKNSVNKNCKPRRKLGKICETAEGGGSIEMLRKDIYGINEKFDIEGGRVINDNGAWAYQIPMNLDYMVTDEFGNLIPSEDTNKGIPTKSSLRFKIRMDNTGGEGRLRTKASFLVPHNPDTTKDIDYTFGKLTSNLHFRDFYWNKIYTIKNHIARFQKTEKHENRNFIGFKDVDNCVGVKNPLPFNKLDTDFNPLYIILCVIIIIILTIITAVNRVIKGIRKIFKKVNYISITCPYNNSVHKPNSDSTKKAALVCFQLALAEKLNVYEFDFYNEWINGTLYSFLLKYKVKKNSSSKFCGDDIGDSDRGNFILNTNPDGGLFNTEQFNEINDGVVAEFEEELFYKPLTKMDHKLYATDIYNLGSVFDCDWQAQSNTHDEIIPTTYNLPDADNDGNSTGITPLLFDLNCVKVDADYSQSASIRRICEIGLGLDESNGNVARNKSIGSEDIIDELLRKKLMKLNNSSFDNIGIGDIDDRFEANDYDTYRKKIKKGNVEQFHGDSFYFYFGSKPNNTAIELMNSKYFTSCSRTVKNILTITGDVIDTTTIGGNEGSISINVIGGLAPYNYKWYKDNLNTSPISTDKDISNLEEGKYIVLVIDSNDVVEQKGFIVGGIQTINANITQLDALNSQTPNGAININSITGGVKPFTVTITGPTFIPQHNNVEYALTVENLSVGTYNILIEDSNTITNTYTKTVIIDTVATLSINITQSTGPTCKDEDDGIINFKVTGGRPDYSISMVGPNGTSTSSSNSGLPEGSYNITVTDSFGQIATHPTIIFTNPLDLVLTAGAGIYTLTNTLEGVSYDLEQDNIVKQTKIATTSGSVIFTGSFGSGDFQGVSEHNCSSEILTI